VHCFAALDIWGFPIKGFVSTYGGGGYIAQFDVNRGVTLEIVHELFKNRWADRQTRAMMFEFTLFNHATNMFVYNVFLIEFPRSGGAFTQHTISPLRLYSHVGAMGTFTLICEVIFAIYVIVFFVKTCVRVYQQRCKYFKEFWQSYDFAMLALSITCIAVYAIRFGFTLDTIKRYKEDERRFVNFSHLVLWDDVLVSCLSILVFMATLRILEIFASSKKVSALVNVFRQCGKDLFWFGMAFLSMIIAYAFLGYLLFGSHLLSYMNIFRCLATLFVGMIGKNNFGEINETQPILAKVYFCLYMMTIIFFVLSIFLSILGASIDKSVQDMKADENEDLIEHLMNRFTNFISKPSANNPTNSASASGNHSTPLQKEPEVPPVVPGRECKSNNTLSPHKLSKYYITCICL